MLPAAIIFITLALLFYTVGVWAEKIKKVLKKWHVIVFWLGFACDTIGTAVMGQIAGSSTQSGLNFHAVTGVAAIVLMFCHAVWATVVIIKSNEKALKSFHKFSIVVWLIWLVPYLTGMVMGMRG